MGFEEYFGNKNTVELLRGMLARNRLPHTVLFSGPSGVGKYTLAQMLAKSQHCLEQENDFCGECRNCRLIGMADDRWAAVERAEQEREKLTKRPREIPLLIQHSPDVLLLPPNGPLRLFQIEQARHLKQALAFQPAAGRKKIFILPEIERMDAAAANSLLKSLEEPPPHSLLLLTTASEAALLPTIRSRCVSFWLSPLPERLVAAFLERKGVGRDAAERRLRAALGKGCPGRALRLDLEHYRQIRDSLLTILQAGLEGKNFAALFAETRKLANEKEGLENLLDVLYSLLQDILHIEAKANGESYRNADRPKLLWQVAHSLGVEGVKRVGALLNSMERNLRRNVPTQISLEAFAAGLAPLHRMSEE
ncbi:MAG: DNA polymerase III subunit [Acidobacteria bacterium]|nr:DNA polymerase III subunit [Acidobacteriota bacterium]